MKRLIVKTSIYFVIALAIVLFFRALSYYRSENVRLEANQTALLEEVTYYKTSDSLNAASVQVLTLSNKELQTHYDDLVKEAESLKLQVKRLESASRTATSTEYNLEMQWQDRLTRYAALIIRIIT